MECSQLLYKSLGKKLRKNTGVGMIILGNDVLGMG